MSTDFFRQIMRIEDWEAILADSYDAPQIIYKHSNSCGTSSFAHQWIEEGVESGELPSPVHLVVVQLNRPLSNQIARDLNVRHESPQVIVVHKGKAAFHTSHRGVRPDAISKAIEDIEE